MRLKNKMKVRRIFHLAENDSLEFNNKHRLPKYSQNDIDKIKVQNTSTKSEGDFCNFHDRRGFFRTL